MKILSETCQQTKFKTKSKLRTKIETDLCSVHLHHKLANFNGLELSCFIVLQTVAMASLAGCQHWTVSAFQTYMSISHPQQLFPVYLNCMEVMKLTCFLWTTQRVLVHGLMSRRYFHHNENKSINLLTYLCLGCIVMQSWCSINAMVVECPNYFGCFLYLHILTNIDQAKKYSFMQKKTFKINMSLYFTMGNHFYIITWTKRNPYGSLKLNVLFLGWYWSGIQQSRQILLSV